jgi:hypothetical protein
MLGDLIPGDELPAAFDEQDQKFERLAFKPQAAIAALQRELFAIESEAAELKDRLRHPP